MSYKTEMLSIDHATAIVFFHDILPFLKDKYAPFLPPVDNIQAEYFQEPSDDQHPGDVYVRFPISEANYNAIKKEVRAMKRYTAFIEHFNTKAAEHGYQHTDVDYSHETVPMPYRGLNIPDTYSLCFYIFL